MVFFYFTNITITTVYKDFNRFLNLKWFPLFIVVVMVLAIYVQTAFFEFLSFDDDYNILLNNSVRYLELKTIWLNIYYGMYIPVTYTIWALVYQLGSDPPAYAFHLLNVLLHLFNAVQVFRISRFLSDKFEPQAKLNLQFGSLIAALFFVCHPVQVESVAWISATRDLLSVSFALVALQVYLADISKRSIILSTLLFGLGLLAKPSIASLPAIFLVSDLFLRRASIVQSIVRLCGMFLLSVGSVLLASSIQADQISKRLISISVLERTLNAIDNLKFYLGKLVLPINLSSDYGQFYQTSQSTEMFIQKFIFICFFILILTFIFRRSSLALKVGASIFILTLLPTLGFVQFFYQSVSAVADRYLYFPLVGASLMISSICNSRLRKLIITLIILIFAYLSFFRTATWQNDKIFYTAMIAGNPLSSIGHLGLGIYLISKGSFQSASVHLNTAVDLDPMNALPYANLFLAMNNLGMHAAVTVVGNLQIANKEFIRINEYTEGMTLFFLGLGYAQFQILDYEQSFKSYCSALFHNPSSDNAKEGLKKIAPLVKNKACF